MKPFSGVFTPIVTPFRNDGAIDEPGMRRNVARWMTSPLTGLVVLGSNGEAPQLDDAEADRVIDIVRSEVPRARPLIAGTGRESTSATIAATRRAASVGVDAALVRTPSFFKSQMTTDVFVRHYTEVADASPIPVLLYNVSMFTGVNLAPEAVETLASHPNIVGMKESGGDIGLIAEYIARTPDDFTVLAGSAATLFHALCAGCDGAILALAAPVLLLCWRKQTATQVRVLAFTTLGTVAVLGAGVIPAFVPYGDPGPAARHLAALQEARVPLAHLGKYHAQYNFAGRLRAPIEILDAPEVKGWVAAHPAGQVITVVRKRHDASNANAAGAATAAAEGGPATAEGGPEYQAPFRGAWVQVWRGAALLVARPELR